MQGESPSRLRVAKGPAREGDIRRSGGSIRDGLGGCGETVRRGGGCYTGDALRRLCGCRNQTRPTPGLTGRQLVRVTGPKETAAKRGQDPDVVFPS